MPILRHLRAAVAGGIALIAAAAAPAERGDVDDRPWRTSLFINALVPAGGVEPPRHLGCGF